MLHYHTPTWQASHTAGVPCKPATILSPYFAGSSEQSSVGGGILSTIFSRIIGAEPAVSGVDTAEAQLNSQPQPQETPQLHELQPSAPRVTAG